MKVVHLTRKFGKEPEMKEDKILTLCVVVRCTECFRSWHFEEKMDLQTEAGKAQIEDWD